MTPDFEEILIKLRAIQPNDTDLPNFWKETLSARDRTSSIVNYYEEYPILKTSISSTLVIIYIIIMLYIIQIINIL